MKRSRSNDGGTTHLDDDGARISALQAGRRDSRPAWMTRGDSNDERAPKAEVAIAAAGASSLSAARHLDTVKSNDVGLGSGNDKWGKRDAVEAKGAADGPLELANFGLSGALARDESAGNAVNGVVKKFSEPPEARIPDRRWRLYVFKGENTEPLATFFLHRSSAFLFGRDVAVADIHVQHPSLSKQHAVIQFRSMPARREPGDMGPTQFTIKPYLMDLESTNGTFLNDEQVIGARYGYRDRGSRN
jgi:hypothetical protein